MNEKQLINLVNKAMQKDNAAMEELYKAYYSEVLFICRKYNLNDEDSQDIAQETFIKAFKEIGTLVNAPGFPKWLSRIASNKCLDLLRHNRTLTMDTISSDESELDIPDKSKSSEEIVLDNEVKKIISEMLSKLPIEQRVTIFMYYYQDYSIKEIAEAYGCSENTVKSRLSYAKKAMRQEAEKLENKGVKLRTIAILPFLYVFFAGEREVFACEIPDCAAVFGQVMGSTMAASGTAAAATAVKAGFFTTLAGRITIGAAALAVVAVGVVTGVAVTGGFDRKKTVDAPTDFAVNITTGDSDNESSDINKETYEEETDDTTDFYEHEIQYLNEAGIEKGDYTFILRKSGADNFDDCIIGIYENGDNDAHYLMSQENDRGEEYYKYAFYNFTVGGRTCSDGVDSTTIFERTENYSNSIIVQRKDILSCSSAEEYAYKRDDASDEDESYYVNDYYVVIRVDKGAKFLAAYKYIDEKNIVTFRMYFDEYTDEGKEFFDSMLRKITIENVGNISNVTGTDRALAYDCLAKLLSEKYGVYLKDYTAIKEFDESKLQYRTENCEYEIQAEVTVGFKEELERGKYELLLDYGDGTALYSNVYAKAYYLLVNENNGCMLIFKMDTDLKEPEEQVELLRQELIK